MLTHQQVADALGCSRQMASNHIKKGCPRTSAEAALAWYASNVRYKADRRRPAVPAVALVGPAPNSRILEVIEDHSAALELDADIRALPGQIASQPDFMPTINNNVAVRRCVMAMHDKWFGEGE